MLVGMLRRPDYPEIFEELKKISRQVILTVPNAERAPEPEGLASEAIDCRLNFRMIPTVLEAYKYAREHISQDDILIIAGSHYTLGEIMKFENIPT